MKSPKTRKRRVAVIAVLCAMGALSTTWARPISVAASATIAGFTPTGAGVGSSVTITGSGFVSGSTVVQFNGQRASIGSLTSTTIATWVPTGATSGPITVTVSGSPTTSATPFTVTPGILPPANAVVSLGGSYAVYGSAFAPYRNVNLTLVSPSSTSTAVGSTTTDGNGNWVATATISQYQASGNYVLEAVDATGVAASHSLTVRADFPQVGFSGRHRGAQPFESILSPSTIQQADVDWSTSIPNTYSDDASPIVLAGGWLYMTTDNGVLQQVNAATGAMGFSVSGLPANATPAVSAGNVFVVSGSKQVTSYTTSASRVWQATCSDCTTSENFNPSAIAVANGLVYVGDNTGAIHAFSVMNGALVWDGSAGTTSSYGIETVAVQGHTLVTVDPDDWVVTWDAITGECCGLVANTSSTAYYSPPVIANGQVCFVKSSQTDIVCFESGDLFVQFTLTGSNSALSGLYFVGLAFDNGELYFVTTDGHLGATDGSGHLIWESSSGGSFTSAPVIANGVIYERNASGEVYAFNESFGNLLWQSNSGLGGGSANLVVANGVLYATGYDVLTAFDLNGGAK
jgi:outer membrane protein assembly factor BamB